MSRVLSLAAVVALSAALAAQQRPNFAGSWTHDAARSRAATVSANAGTGRSTATLATSGPATVLNITQTAATLTIERVAGTAKTTTVYKLDGAESVNKTGDVTTRTKSRWEGARLVSDGTQVAMLNGEERSVPVREVRSLEPDGALKIEIERRLPTGPSRSVMIFTKNR